MFTAKRAGSYLHCEVNKTIAVWSKMERVRSSRTATTYCQYLYCWKGWQCSEAARPGWQPENYVAWCRRSEGGRKGVLELRERGDWWGLRGNGKLFRKELEQGRPALGCPRREGRYVARVELLIGTFQHVFLITFPDISQLFLTETYFQIHE